MLMDAEKAFNEIQHPFTITQWSGFSRSYLDIIKAKYEKPTAKIILNNEKLKAFSVRLRIRQGCLLSPLVFSIVLKVLVREIRQEK